MPITGDAPDFTLKSVEGKEVSLGKITPMFPALLVFFSSRGDACELMMPLLREFGVAYNGADLEILAISQDSRAEAAGYLKSIGWSGRILVDPAPYDVSRAYGIRELPAAVLVDCDNTIVASAEGVTESGFNALSRAIADLAKWSYAPVVPGETPAVEPQPSRAS